MSKRLNFNDNLFKANQLGKILFLQGAFCKIRICTWPAMGFPGITTLPGNKSHLLANFAKGSRVKPLKGNRSILLYTFVYAWEGAKGGTSRVLPF